MSYLVTVKAKDIQPWFYNAWKHVHSDDFEAASITMDTWNKTYNTIITFEKKPELQWKVTFSTEQDYTWFLLRWS